MYTRWPHIMMGKDAREMRAPPRGINIQSFDRPYFIPDPAMGNLDRAPSARRWTGSHNHAPFTETSARRRLLARYNFCLRASGATVPRRTNADVKRYDRLFSQIEYEAPRTNHTIQIRKYGHEERIAGAENTVGRIQEMGRHRNDKKPEKSTSPTLKQRAEDQNRIQG